MKQKFPVLFLFFLVAILVLNLFQAGYTQIIFDEAYYWYYAEDLAWGYFDHPPMVAFLIWLGSLLFEGELGIRFVSCLLGAGTMIVLWLSIDSPKKNESIPHFFILLLSMPLLHAYGFLTLPDTPLLFFTALFFLTYKKFLTSSSFITAFFLGLLMAALMYSKYHGVLVIFFVFLSNLRLAKNPFAWFAVLIALLSYSPHLFWLFENNFVSIKYHLFERPNRPYEFFDFTLGYILNLIAIFGLPFFWIYKALFNSRSSNLFMRSLLFVSYGVLLFFLISSFQRRVQTQWVIVICIPVALLVFNYMLNHANTRNWIYRLGIVNILLLLFLRVGLIYEPLFPVIYETHGNKSWVGKITSQIGDMPVVFENSYRMAPMFAFYSGNTSFSLNNVWYRENQYSIDQSEELVRGQKVLYVSKYLSSGDISFTMPDGTLFYGVYIDPFQSYRDLRTEIVDLPGLEADTNCTFRVMNPYPFEISLNELEFGLVLLNKYKQVLEVLPLKATQEPEMKRKLEPEENQLFQFQFPQGELEEVKYVKVVISENGLRWGLNGKKIAIH